MPRWMLSAGIAAFACTQALGSSSTATYQVSFQATWSAGTHPGAYPASAHFSPLIGGVHSDRVSFWEPGGIATPGIERMAETGATSTLRAEVNAQITAGDALAVVNGPGINSPASGSTTFTASTVDGMTRLTLVTMIAPSPDWFVGVHGLDLRDGDGWVGELTVDLPAYDAGTDSGANFNSGNADTNPQDPIADFTGVAPFGGTPALGTFTLSLISVEVCLADTNGDGTLNVDDIDGYVAAFLAGDLAADLDANGILNVDDIDVFVGSFLGGC